MSRAAVGLLSAFSLGIVLAASGAATGGGAVVGETVEGTLIGPGVECPQFQLKDGEVVSLTGQPPEAAGPYRLSGRWARFSYCMQGRTFDVQAFVGLSDEGDSK